jgi:hypothetical protein
MGKLIACFPSIYERHRKRRVKQFFYCRVFVAAGTYLPSHCLATIEGIHIRTHEESKLLTSTLDIGVLCYIGIF